MNRIIIIGGGNHHNTLGVIRALGERNYGVELITIGDCNKHYVSSSKYVTQHVAIPNISDLSSYLINRKPAKEGIKDIIISCADAVTEHLNNHLNQPSDTYILPGTQKEGEMVKLMNKTTMIEMVSKRGISAPKIWKLPDEIEKVEFPCITKTYVSSHGRKADIVICNKRSELDLFIIKNNDPVFAQIFIDKKEEIQFIGCSLRNGDEVIIPGMSKILRSQPNTNTGFLEYGPIDSFYNDTIEKARQYIQDCKYSGLFSFEILRGKDDKVWFLEINFRNDGNAWCVTKSGINLPLIWVKACLGIDFRDEIRIPNHILMMPEFQDFKLVLERKVSPIQWIKDWKRTDFFMEYDPLDKRPFWQYIINKII